MALKRSGVVLVAENYQTYLKQLRDVNKVHKEAFNTSPLKAYKEASKQAVENQKKMSQAAKSTQAVVQNLRNAFTNAASSSGSFSGALGSLKGAASAAGLSLGTIGTLSAGAVLGITGLGAAAVVTTGGIYGMVKALGFLWDATEVAQAQETMGVVLEEVGRHAGYTSKQIDLATQLLKDQGITTQAAEKSLVRMARANISWAEATKLAQIAQGSAIGTTLTSSEAFERLITGIQKMEPELLDELGIQIRRDAVYKKFAQTLGISSDALTDAQRQQAILNEIYAQSESVMGVYNAAMETSGKKQQSLTRMIEEARGSFGKVLLPIKELAVNLQTEFWRGMQIVSKGFESWGPAIKVAIQAIGNVAKTLGGLFGLDFSEASLTKIWNAIGKDVHQLAQKAVYNIVAIESRIIALAEIARDRFQAIGKVVRGMLDKDWKTLLEGVNELDFSTVTSDFDKLTQDHMVKGLQKVKAQFPDLFKTWEEFNNKVKGSPDDLQLPVTPETPAIDTEQLESVANAYKKLDDIQRKFTENSAKLADEATKGLQKIRDEAVKAEQALAEKRDKALAKLEQDSAKQRAKIIQEAARDEKKRQKELHRDMENELKRFQLSQVQLRRRFNVSDRRLRAEGDILALMELRENFELEQKENRENFDLERDQKKQAAEDEAKEAKEELDRRLEELRVSIEERRAEIQASYEEELADLQVANAEKEEEFKRSMEERFNELVAARNKEIEELGRSLSEEKKITQEGMTAIADEIRRIFGEDQAGDALIKGWTERTTSAFGQLVSNVEAQLGDLQNAVNTMSQAPTNSLGFAPGRTGGRGGRRGRPIGMRHGGEGVVTGPAHFFVEPGQREFVKFVPMNQGGAKHTLGGRIGLDVSGLPAGMNEKLENSIIERAADLAVSNIEIAIERIKRRS